MSQERWKKAILLRVKRILGNLKLNSGPECKSKPRQLAEIIYLALRYRFSPIEYRTYRFFVNSKTIPEMTTYLSNYEISHKIRPELYDRSLLPMLTNKLIFNRYYSASGLPLPRFYAFYHPNSGFTADDPFLRTESDLRNWLNRNGLKRFFAKPCGGKKGSGILAVSQVVKSGNDFLLTNTNGNVLDLKDLVSYLHREAEESTYPGYLFEEMIEQHPALNRINPASVNTCRLLTLTLSDNSISIPLAVMRFGRKGSPVDSWSKGGIAFKLDPETGELGRGLFHPDWGSTKHVARHPDNNAEVTGMVLPYWDEIKKVACKAASVTPGINSIGWDLAITEHGPLLVEGNSLWSPLIFQAIYGGLLSPENKGNFERARVTLR